MTITDINTSLYQKVGDDMYRINLQTTAGQVKTADGSDVETRLASLGADEILALGEEVDALKALGAELGDTLNAMSAAVSAARDAADAAASAAGGLGERLEELEAARPGIWARVDELEKPFTPPAEDEDGKKGLVPAPGSMTMEAAREMYLGADAHWHNRYLAPDYYNSLSLFQVISHAGDSTLSYKAEFTIPENGYLSVDIVFGKGDFSTDQSGGDLTIVDKNAPQGTPNFLHSHYTDADYGSSYENVFKPVSKNTQYTVTVKKNKANDLLQVYIYFVPLKEAD